MSAIVGGILFFSYLSERTFSWKYMNIYVDFSLRLFVAGLMGVLIGLEREYRAKEAGYRTHFLVALGSALLMIEIGRAHV